ncbi:unnamed protein product [Ostreobium quekettii]|uniref:Elongator complex protein 2 n=1 Tax=Ostreobium quekettii TaxID=121088 RepID=A0A8S1J8U5_9CHLO|nr:unnamed protein product [Ostreobium quekettii]
MELEAEAVGWPAALCCSDDPSGGSRLYFCRAALALGGTDCRVHLWLRQPGGHFEKCCRLSGHQDWVRSLAFLHAGQGQSGGERLLLASASQDRYIRIWCIRRNVEKGSSTSKTDPPSSTLSRLGPSSHFTTQHSTYSVALESLLIGHEDWVHSVQWSPPIEPGPGVPSIEPRPGAPSIDESGARGLSIEPGSAGPIMGTVQSGECAQPLLLLSASMDRTMMVWEYDGSCGLWMNKESVGDAGSTALGYYGGVFGPDGLSIMAHGFTGALHLWRREDGRQDGGWVPHHAMTGHYGEVLDLSWALDGSCLITVGGDQTARITARVDGHWCEIARPQVHGHDFFGLAVIPPTTTTPGRNLYASCSEEKVIRVFEAPQAFHDTLSLAQGCQHSHANGQAAQSATGQISQGPGCTSRPLGAVVKALGLTNKAVYADEGTASANDGPDDRLVGIGGDQYAAGPEFAPAAAPTACEGPPFEEHLSQNTLWPEVHKLYGHGDNVTCLAADPTGRWLVSACKAQSPEVAAIWVWDIQEWRPAGTLQAHTLTVTQLQFSNSGRYLLSGSRDRTFGVFALAARGRLQDGGGSQGDGSTPLTLLKRMPKAHSRIIWGVDWSPDDRFIATGSRDQRVKIWEMTEMGPLDRPIHSLPPMDCSVTSVAFAPQSRVHSDSVGNGSTHGRQSNILAVGLQDGSIQVWELTMEATSMRSRQLWRSCRSNQHSDSVKRLRWTAAANQGGLYLASCSADHSLRVFEITP